MFAKPYKLKSNNTLKNSEKKQLIQRIKDEFPAVTDERIKELVPSKSAVSCLKLVLSSGDTVGVFVSEGYPMLVDTAGGLVPTVCALWKVPEMVPTITIHALVLPKVQGGAPLYLPGVHLPAGGAGFPVFARGAVLAARTHDCAAAALVGRAAMGSGDMLLRAAGVCVEPAHVLGDQLCRDTRFARLDRPNALAATQAPRNTEDSLATNLNQLNIQPTLSKEEWPSLGRPAPAPAAPAAPPPAPNAPKLISAEPTPDSQSESAATEDLDDNQSTDDESEAIPEDMDGLLRWCLLTYLKLHAKTAELPIKTSLLYRNHLVPLCPGELALDVKKSSYKKMSKFLEAMQQAGLLEVHELERGVDAVTALNALHPSVRAHRVPAHVRARAQRRDEGEEREYAPPVVREMLCVTAAVLDLLTVKKGTALTSGEVRQALTDYVKSRSLTSTEQRGAVRLDSLLAKITGKQEQSVLKWDALMLGVQSRMTAATEMRFADGTLRLTKTRLEPVTMKVATRSGNKKVTLVSNLESFGFVLSALSGACQRAVGASCGVTRAPGALADQLMLQGDQTHFVAKLLVEKYGLPKKFLEGADKALNKKK